jgi:hypothetical protein
VQHACRSGVEQLSLTDHDTLAGLEEASAEADALGIRFMPGIEFTCRFEGQSVHVLGYGFDPGMARSDRRLTSYLEQVRQRDRAWARALCRKSCAEPLIVTAPGQVRVSVCVAEDELSWARGTMPSPFHFAVVLARKLAAISDELDIPARHCMYLFTGRPEPERHGESYWPALRDRYDGVLGRYGLAARSHWWIPRPTADLLDVAQALEMLGRIGGIPVLAHPGEQKLSPQQIERLVGLGMRGIEVYTFKHNVSYVASLEALALSLDVLATAGSDFHDPHHRAQVELGKDRSGTPLTRGHSLSDFRALGAFVTG